MVQMIIDRYGRGAIAKIAAAWRNGDGDAEALEAGTGISATQLYARLLRLVRRGGAEGRPAGADPPLEREDPAAARRLQPAARGNGKRAAVRVELAPASRAAAPVGTTGLLLLGAAVVGVGIGAAVAVRRRRHAGRPGMTRRNLGRLLLRPQWAVSVAAALAVIGFVGFAQWNGSPERQQFVDLGAAGAWSSRSPSWSRSSRTSATRSRSPRRAWWSSSRRARPPRPPSPR